MKCSLLAILAGVATLFVNAEFFNAPTNGTQVVAGSYFNITWQVTSSEQDHSRKAMLTSPAGT